MANSKLMQSSEVRSQFINYFKKQGHAAVASSSLIPENDPTLLFANAGMNQFKNLFLGLEHRDYKRAVSSQKCVRAGGKHNDLENVGFTARHHTFFEMLGNFSFGDYFKKDAIHFAWELLTKDFAIPKEKLYVTVHLSDDEAADIWHKQEGIPRDRIFRFDQDNFWRMGDVGPCGPCTEIFYDHGVHAGRESDPFKGIAAGEDRFVEIWNLVFMQFYESAPGKSEPLPKPSVDTGSGLERVTAALQGKLNNYDTDLFWPMITRAAEISKKTNLLPLIEQLNKEGIHSKIDPRLREQIAALRVIADHTRSCSMLMADGALPSNEGRGYVLRRILRRAVRFSQMLSGGDPFLPEISQVLISELGKVYPELQSRKDIILSTIRDEQDRFMSTLLTGTQLLNEELKKLKSKNTKEVPGDVVFKLYDTFGFPADLTKLMANEQGFSVDENKFEEVMTASKEKAKASWKGKSIASDEAHLVKIAQEVFDKSKATQFVGYESTTGTGKILLLSDGSQKVSGLKAGQSGVLISDKTPFYAEGGGQVGDTGTVKTSIGEAKIHNTSKQLEVYLHFIEVTKGEIKSAELIELQVAHSDRRSTENNHSATHLMHAALKKVLGSHVGQAGSLVEPQRLRFDFTHNKPITPDQIEKIESMVNEEIAKGIPVSSKIMKHKDAIAAGAVAMFGEKYGEQVRVISMGEFSTELCGGTHVANTSQIRVFKILSESGVSAGVRRIEAMTGDTAVQYLMKYANEDLMARSLAGIQESQSLQTWIESKKEEIRSLEKEIKKLQGGQINVDQLAQAAQSFKSKSGNSKIILVDVGIEDRDVLAQVTDQLKNKIQSGVVIVVGQGAGTHPLIVSVSKDLNPEITAGSMLKEIAQVMGGKGGGRPDFAQGAVPDRSKLSDAFKKAQQMVGL